MFTALDMLSVKMLDLTSARVVRFLYITRRVASKMRASIGMRLALPTALMGTANDD
jgi:hypothetical protein